MEEWEWSEEEWSRKNHISKRRNRRRNLGRWIAFVAHVTVRLSQPRYHTINQHDYTILETKGGRRR